MQGFKITYKGKTYEGTEFIGHGDGSIIELVAVTNKGSYSVLIAPAVLCEIERFIISSKENKDLEQKPEQS